ncbi:hypothetical protein Tco_1543252 [Tanacetum coccineum]
MLRAFSLFLLALAASEVFVADEDAGSVVAWSPLVLLVSSEKLVYTASFVRYRTKRNFWFSDVKTISYREVRAYWVLSLSTRGRLLGIIFSVDKTKHE